MNIIVASKNPVKIEAARLAFERMFPGRAPSCEGVSASSEVRDQPLTDTETYEGAFNRVKNARIARPEADYWISFEGGLEEKSGAMEVFAWVAV